MRRCLRQVYRQRWQDDSGAAAVEFAMVVGPLLIFIFAILNVGLYFFALQSLDQATRLAARRILTGDVQVQGLTAAKFKTDMLCPVLTLPLPCADITVNVSRVGKTSDALQKTGIYAFIRQSLPDLVPPNLSSDNGSFCTGGPGEYVFVDVAYNYVLLMNMSSFLFGATAAANTTVLRSTYFLSNEPYPNSSGPTSC